MTQKTIRKMKQFFSLMLVLVMMIGIITPGSATVVKAEGEVPSYSNLSDDYQEKLLSVTEYLENVVPDIVTKSNYYSWIIMQSARFTANKKRLYHDYYDYITEETKNLTTADYATRVLALTAIGADPSNINEKNFIEQLTDYETVKTAGIDTVATALIALNSKSYAEENTEIRNKLADCIVDSLPEETGLYHYYYDYGEWGVFEGDSYDSTGTAIQALAPYYDKDNVKKIVDTALETLSKKQRADGSFGGDYDDRVSSTSQVLCGLIAMDIDPEEDTRFIKNGNSTLDYILSNYNEETYMIAPEGVYDPTYSSYQAAIALCAYYRYKYEYGDGANYIYDMTDVEGPIYSCGNNNHTWGTEVEEYRKATCTEDGVNAIRCQICGEVKPDTKEKGENALGHKGGTATCSERAICDRCGQEYGELNPNKHGKTEIKNAKEPTCTEKGYTGDKVCVDCEEIVENGKEIAAKGHTPVEIPAIPATETTPGKTAGKKCSVCGEVLEAPKDIPATGKKEGPVQQTVEATPQFVSDGYEADGSKLTYKDDNDSTAKKLVIPATIKEDGKTYKVTKIAAGACKGNKNLTSVSVGKNVTSIGKNAFNGCLKLKTITIKGKVTSVGKNAFAGISKKATIKIKASKKQYKKTVKLIKKSGIPKTVKFKRV